jgi:UDP-glucose 4-epimerase
MGEFTNETVLVTGGAGFIGSHVVEALLREDARVMVVDNMSTGSVGNLEHLLPNDGLSIIEADISQVPSSAMDGVTMGVHLAALTEVAASIDDPVSTVEANVLGSIHILAGLQEAGARSAVVASSAAVYGEVPVPVDEEGPSHPISPYGVGKLAVDHFVRYYANHTEMAVCSLRFFNVYGPRQHPRSPYSGVISVFTAGALTGENLLVNGDGEQPRDFVYVKDVVRGILLALRSPDARGEAMNIGTGQATSIIDLARSVISIVGSHSDMRHGPPRSGDIRHSVAKVDKASSLLSFKASTTLQEGLASTVHWMRDQL